MVERTIGVPTLFPGKPMVILIWKPSLRVQVVGQARSRQGPVVVEPSRLLPVVN